jgi:hypothetical protein
LRLDTLAHHRAAQWPDAVDHVQPQAAHALHRQKIREQRAVEQIDGERAGADVGEV